MECLPGRSIKMIGRRVAFHAEDEGRPRERMSLRGRGVASSHPGWRDEAGALTATERLVRMAEKRGKRVHVHRAPGRLSRSRGGRRWR
jgi:dihydroorotase